MRRAGQWPRGFEINADKQGEYRFLSSQRLIKRDREQA